MAKANGHGLMASDSLSFRFYFFIVLSAGIFLRFFHLDQTPPGLYYDEYFYALDGWNTWKTHVFHIFYTNNNGREGLFIWLLALGFSLFGDSIETIRGISAFFGSLTLIIAFLLTRELFYNHPKRQWIALLAMFLLAFSFWHLNFSRIVFRASLTPFFETTGLWLLLRAIRTKETLDFILAAAVVGLGLYTYPAYWIFPPLALFVLWQSDPAFGKQQLLRGLMVTVTFLIVTSPLTAYIYEHQDTFFNRVSHITLMHHEADAAPPNPILRFVRHCRDIIIMLFFRGDNIWRHNVAAMPELGPLAMLGVIAAWTAYGYRAYQEKERFLLVRVWTGRTIKTTFVLEYAKPMAILGLWAMAAATPAVFSWTANHALRAIGMVVPMQIMAAAGLVFLWEVLYSRHRQWLKVMAVLLLLMQAFCTIYLYFGVWAKHPETRDAFTYWVFEHNDIKTPGFMTSSPLKNLLTSKNTQP